MQSRSHSPLGNSSLEGQQKHVTMARPYHYGLPLHDCCVHKIQAKHDAFFQLLTLADVLVPFWLCVSEYSVMSDCSCGHDCVLQYGASFNGASFRSGECLAAVVCTLMQDGCDLQSTNKVSKQLHFLFLLPMCMSPLRLRF